MSSQQVGGERRMQPSGDLETRATRVISETVTGPGSAEGIEPKTDLRRDLGVDSFVLSAIVFGLEDEFGIELVDRGLDPAEVRTVQDIFELLAQILRSDG